MKKCFITLIMVVGFALASTFDSYSMEAYAPQQKTVTNTDKSVEKKSDDAAGWILIGEVELIGRSNIKANLYVRALANRIFYRIEYAGKYYAAYSKGEDRRWLYVDMEKGCYGFIAPEAM